MAYTQGVPVEFVDAIVNKECGIIRKTRHYFNIYHLMFQRFIEKNPIVLEIGVENGGSLYTWKRYFRNATIYGIDCNEECKKFDGEGVKVFIGNQEDQNFLKDVIAEIGAPDIIIDDGGHYMSHTIVSLETLFPLLKNYGVYAIEDIGTSYWNVYGGGYKKPGTIIEYIKNLLDDLHSKHISPNNDNYDGTCDYIKEVLPGVDSLFICNCLCMITKDINTNHNGGMSLCF